MAPKATPPAIVDKLNAEIRRIVARQELRDDWAKQGAVPMTMTPPEFARYLEQDIVKWERIVKLSGAKPDQ
jgi:tripartite-type tricarboxylate transporter receptor subunit TctC